MSDLARVRQHDVKELFKYNLMSSCLFEADGLMTTTQKTSLITELEKHLVTRVIRILFLHQWGQFSWLMSCLIWEKWTARSIQHLASCVMPFWRAFFTFLVVRMRYILYWIRTWRGLSNTQKDRGDTRTCLSIHMWKQTTFHYQLTNTILDVK